MKKARDHRAFALYSMRQHLMVPSGMVRVVNRHPWALPYLMAATLTVFLAISFGMTKLSPGFIWANG